MGGGVLIEITSVHNPKIKSAAKLMNRRERDASGQFLIEGQREVQRALEMDFPIVSLFVCAHFMSSQEFARVPPLFVGKGIEVFPCSETVFKKISYRENPDGFLAIALQKHRTLDELALLVRQKKNPLILVAEGIEKPGNLGTLLRSCDACGVDALILSDKTTDVFNPNVVRSSVGTLFSIPIIEAEGQHIIDFLKENQIQMAAATPEGAIPYTDYNFKRGVAVVIGTEHAGLSLLWKQAADACLAIPMHGLADSLNVTVAATVILYEALRQRHTSKP